ncbi:hypothetical protein CKO28_22605 [Rhodovibrio sodomensis]|uniref:Response regulatory domain-containing protein n=1 Tax=Rhodovibrio sodomensis TaxID=1088 RepID=A0ABS1DK18_9PROT|nr:response regulator [Rhodovibrio sodomensis]MBK1670812.1 hypothetical protein [Rhodovibrio sodomensis]
MTAPPETLAGRHILIAEDEYLIARDMEHTLVDAGCAQVSVVPSIDACLSAAAHSRPDAVVLDLRLRDGDAGDLARQMRSNGLPVIFITGYEETAIPDDLTDLPVLAKPIPRKRLVCALVTALEARFSR